MTAGRQWTDVRAALVIGAGAGTVVALVSRALTAIGDLLAAAVAAGYFRRTRARCWDVVRGYPE